MHRITFAPNFADWQPLAREALRSQLPPDAVVWEERDAPATDLPFESEPTPAPAPERPVARVPKQFLDLAKTVSLHRAGTRWSLLYRVLWRLTRGEPKLLEVVTDPDVARLHAMAKSIRRDIHKMRAFVRFREVTTPAGAWFVAWFEPEHRIVEANAPFFLDRFAAMRWSILTPEICAHWDLRALTFTPGMSKSDAPSEDATEDLWRTYYGSIFNPARLKPHAMRAEMPKKYWKNLPEAALIPTLLAEAPRRTESMIDASDLQSTPPPAHTLAMPPETDRLEVLAEAAAGCRACPLYAKATQTVFGQGARDAAIVFVGEQPGDQEDRQGEPFVGPAGKLFDRALAAAGIARETTYVTNTVKHFKWEPRGKRRLHQTPSARDVASCRPWLEAELRVLQPQLVVALGSTAAKALLGSQFRVTQQRGEIFQSEFSDRVLATVHPSSLLRLPAGVEAAAEFERFVADLRTARQQVNSG